MMDNFGISDRLCDMDESDFSRDLMPDLNNILQQDMMEMACQEYEMAMSDENSSDKSFDAENLNLVSHWTQNFCSEMREMYVCCVIAESTVYSGYYHQINMMNAECNLRYIMIGPAATTPSGDTAPRIT